MRSELVLSGNLASSRMTRKLKLNSSGSVVETCLPLLTTRTQLKNLDPSPPRDLYLVAVSIVPCFESGFVLIVLSRTCQYGSSPVA